jgi:hypothetical protein
MNGLVLETSEAHFGNETEGNILLITSMKITPFDDHATSNSAAFFRALVVHQLPSLLGEKEPKTSSNQPIFCAWFELWCQVDLCSTRPIQ